MIYLTPFVQTDDSRCGPACVKMVLNYYGIIATEDEICNRCNWTYELGCTNVGIKLAFESYGLQCKIKDKATLDDLRKAVKQKIPVIVDWFSGGCNPSLSDTPNGHASVVVDVDDSKVYIVDPETGQTRDILHTDWMRTWFDWQKTPTISPDTLRIRQMIIAFK